MRKYNKLNRKPIYIHHEAWEKENGYRDNDLLHVKNTERFLIIEKKKSDNMYFLYDKKRKIEIDKKKKQFNAFIGLAGIKDYKKLSLQLCSENFALFNTSTVLSIKSGNLI